jgi:hypothetical protein
VYSGIVYTFLNNNDNLLLSSIVLSCLIFIAANIIPDEQFPWDNYYIDGGHDIGYGLMSMLIFLLGIASVGMFVDFRHVLEYSVSNYASYFEFSIVFVIYSLCDGRLFRVSSYSRYALDYIREIEATNLFKKPLLYEPIGGFYLLTFVWLAVLFVELFTVVFYETIFWPMFLGVSSVVILLSAAATIGIIFRSRYKIATAYGVIRRKLHSI